MPRSIDILRARRERGETSPAAAPLASVTCSVCKANVTKEPAQRCPKHEQHGHSAELPRVAGIWQTDGGGK